MPTPAPTRPVPTWRRDALFLEPVFQDSTQWNDEDSDTEDGEQDLAG